MKRFFSTLSRPIPSKPTAVITGAASGIGKGIAYRCIKEGMNVVLADIEEEPTYKLAENLERLGGNVLPIQVDMSNHDDVKRLSEVTLKKFDHVDLLFSNAGVSGPFGPIWETPIEQFNWTMQTNLMGTVFLLKEFLPIMLSNKSLNQRHVVITSSHLGLNSEHSLAAYGASKQALVGLAESTQQDLEREGSKIKVSVFFPYFVQSNLPDSARHRQGRDLYVAKASEDLLADLTQLTDLGITPEESADCIFRGMEKGELYIFTDPRTQEAFSKRASIIIGDYAERKPSTAPEN